MGKNDKIVMYSYFKSVKHFVLIIKNSSTNNTIVRI